MLISTNKERLHAHYFVLPFKCERCGNTFMLEWGLRRKNDLYNDFSDRLDGIRKYEKYCGICPQEIAAREEGK